MRSGDEGGGTILRAGDCCRLVNTLGSIKLLRLRSREPVTRETLNSEPGESARRGPERTDDRTLESLSAPVSLSMCIEARLLCDKILIAPPVFDLGVGQPRGLFERVDAAVDEAR